MHRTRACRAPSPNGRGVARGRRGAAAPAADGGLFFRVSGRLRPRRSASASWMCVSGASPRAVDPDAPAGDHQTLEKASATWMQTTCTQVCSPTRPAHPLPACPVRKRERGQGLIGVVLRVWGWFLALAAPSRDPATDSTPCSLPCARSLDLASGPETLSCPCWGHSRGRAGRGIATESGPTPSRQCRTASARTAGPRFSADCSCGCGRVGGLLVRGGRVGWALPYVVGGCWAAQLAQLAQPWAKVPTLVPCMAPLLTCPYTPPHGENPHVSWSRVRYVGTYGSQGCLHSVSPCER